MAIYTEGIMADGACILKDGAKMTISDVLAELNESAGNVTEAKALGRRRGVKIWSQENCLFDNHR